MEDTKNREYANQGIYKMEDNQKGEYIKDRILKNGGPNGG